MDWKKEKLQSIWRVNKEKLIFLFCSGLLLFILAIPGGEKKDQPAAESAAAGPGSPAVFAAPQGGTDSYEKELEERVEALLSGVDGVGEVEVLVVLKSSEEKILHVDQNSSSSVTEETNANGTGRITRQQELSESTVLEGQASAPVVEKELMPEISGIIISADGGGSAVVRAEISEAMEALFGLPSHKIKVLKRVKKGA